MSGWDDLVTVALLGTDRRPLPPGLSASWAGPEPDPTDDPAAVVLNLAARHRSASRAGSSLHGGPPSAAAPPADEGEPLAANLRAELADAVARGTVGPLNDALAGLDDQDHRLPREHWTTVATLAAQSPRLDRALLARALGVRGVWFVAQNPQWLRLATALRSRLDGRSG